MEEAQLSETWMDRVYSLSSDREQRRDAVKLRLIYKRQTDSLDLNVALEPSVNTETKERK